MNRFTSYEICHKFDEFARINFKMFKSLAVARRPLVPWSDLLAFAWIDFKVTRYLDTEPILAANHIFHQGVWRNALLRNRSRKQRMRIGRSRSRGLWPKRFPLPVFYLPQHVYRRCTDLLGGGSDRLADVHMCVRLKIELALGERWS